MKRKVRTAYVGIGIEGSLMVRYSIQHGAQPVAAFGHSDKTVGRDLGELAGVGPLGLAVQHVDRIREVFAQTKPDICLVSARGTLAEVEDILLACAEGGVNCINIGEEATWPWTTNPELANRLDQLARANNCTLTSSGCPEIGWGAIVSCAMGACASVTKVRIKSTLNLEDYGVLYLYDNHHVGMTLANWEAEYGGQVFDEVDGHVPCFPGDQNSWMCDYLGLTPLRQTCRHIPQTVDFDVYSKNLDRTIPAGSLIGEAMVISTETAEGITVEYELACKIYTPGDAEHYEYIIYGEPDQTVIHWELPNTPISTAATPVNRIPDVINARPGYVTTRELPRNRYLARSMEEYVGLDE